MKLTIDTKWLDAISGFDDGMRLELLDAIFAHLEGKEVNIGKESCMIFYTLLPFINEEADKRARLAERSRENGQKGGRKKQASKKTVTKGYMDYLEEPEYQGRCEKLKLLDEWLRNNVPYIYTHMRPLKQKEFECLHPKYSSLQICDTFKQIENRKDLRKRYTDPYRTLLNWMKTEYGQAGTNNG